MFVSTFSKITISFIEFVAYTRFFWVVFISLKHHTVFTFEVMFANMALYIIFIGHVQPCVFTLPMPTNVFMELALVFQEVSTHFFGFMFNPSVVLEGPLVLKRFITICALV